MNLLQNIKSPADLKQLPLESLPALATEIRERLISVLSDIGGHLGGNLGAVELTIALHYVFDSPRDKLIWDTGHQSYVHKILTGRNDQLSTIRQLGGLAGFAKIGESEHDIYGAGHASTSISSAYGFAVSRDLAGEDHQVVTVIGDGAMTGGLAFEGLNNVGHSRRNMLVILNDNSMSISKNVGAISEYLTGLISDQTYNRMKEAIWNLTGKVRKGSRIREIVGKIDESIKSVFVPGVIFEKLGLRYFGPINGHDVIELVKILQQLKPLSGPRLLHIRTQKGKGYLPAEDDSCCLHGVSKFDKITGKSASSEGIAYTKVFGEALVEIARKDEKVIALTAAMPSGTGLTKFAEVFPDRFFDVGIAEQHAAIFSAGLSLGGRKPVAAIYSTFLQRAFDPLIHDIALQDVPLILALDRAGLVGNDGPTHHGCFDLSYLRLIPGFVVCAPKDGTELVQLLQMAVARYKEPVAIRFPRADIPEGKLTERPPFEWGTWEIVHPGKKVAILAVGTMVDSSLKAVDLLKTQGLDPTIVNCRFVKPLDQQMILHLVETHRIWITVEEATLVGGFGSAINDWLSDNDRRHIKLRRLGIPDNFIEHGSRDKLLEMVSLHPQGIAAATSEFVQHEGRHSLTMKSPLKPAISSEEEVEISTQSER